MIETIGTTLVLTSLFFLSYGYFGYPLFLWVANKFKGESLEIPVGDATNHSISVIITAYNERDRICEKISNTLALTYPSELLEIIVASDGSDDGTDELVRDYPQIKLLSVPGRLGKEATQHRAVEQSKGEVLVFTDVSTMLEPNALQKISMLFSNSEIGALSSEDKFLSPDGTVSGEGAYVRYEMALRKLEGSFNSLVGLSGSFFACRKGVCDGWDNAVPSDFGTALRCVKNGLRAVTGPDLYGFYKDVSDPSREYTRKVRTVLRGINGLRRESAVLNPGRFGWFAFQIWSHKVIRWLGPVWITSLAIGSCLLATANPWGLVLIVGQAIFYITALMPFGFLQRLTALPRYFVIVNTAMAHALYLSYSGVTQVTWEPSKR